MDASVSGARVALLEHADPGVGEAEVGLQVDDTLVRLWRLVACVGS